MFMSSLILILSVAFFFFYLQGICQKILRRQFEQAFWRTIVNANGLEFPSIRKCFDGVSAPVPYTQLMTALKCDFMALAYLLKNAANPSQRYTLEERFLIAYFKLVAVSLVTRHWLRLQEKPAALKLTAILKYFANVVGERVSADRFGNMTASDYLSNL
jgi:hypothetical protein